MIRNSFAFILFISSLHSLAAVKVAKDINYAENEDPANTLNVYYGNGGKQDKPVLVFIHGGSWSSGKKETYWWLGRNFAKKGVVTVVINYPLAPGAAYEKMALSVAKAIKWVKANVKDYQGSAGNIFVMGHSAGGHLAELVNADPRYFKTAGIQNPIKGIILNDGFGLDMHEYLTKTTKDSYYHDFIRTFSLDEQAWKAGSPLTYGQHIKNPHLLLYGAKTYEAIRIQTPRLHQLLLKNGVQTTMLEVPRRKHVPMIAQMIFGSNILYQHITEFIKNNFR